MPSDNVIPFPQQGVNIGGPIDDASVSLCLYGDDLDPDALTRLLGLAPTHSPRKGEPRKKPGLPPFPQGAWIHKVERRTGPGAVDLALGCLLDQLPADPALWAALAERHEVRLSLSVSFEGWNKGFTLGPRTLQRVAALGVRLDVDLYASDHYPPELDRILNHP